MRRAAILLLLVGLLSLPRQSHAQTLVLDVANLAQTTITDIEEVLSVANQVLELTRLGSIAINDTYGSDLASLATIVQQAQGLSYDLSSLNSQIQTYFDLHSAPDNTTDLANRLGQIRQITVDSYVYAMRTQTLLKTTLSTVRHLTSLANAISAYLGNMQGNQSLAQVESTLAETLERLQVQTNAYERAQSVERLTDPLIMESIHNINKNLLFDWPR